MNGEPPRQPVSLRISLTRQHLEVVGEGVTIFSFPVSTSRYGPGEQRDSGCTPRGRHVIRARIGAGLDPYAVLRGRRPTGEIWSPRLALEHPGRDWILGRILWLSGREPGRNRLGMVDSMRRYIYIHGTPDTEPMGVPFSHGCVRMRCNDLVRLFDMVEAGTVVDIAT